MHQFTSDKDLHRLSLDVHFVSLTPVPIVTFIGGQTLFLVSKTARKSRVGKGRPASSSELRDSPSPSKIPYGGFSPVRLQMDRQWRPSTTSRGLSGASQDLYGNSCHSFC